MVVVLGGVGQIAGTVYAALGLGILNKLLEGWQGAVLAKIMRRSMKTMLGVKGWAAVAAATVTITVLVPVLSLMVPDGNLFHLSDYSVSLLGKILCYAICALAMDLIWGYTGILSLGHGVFFAIGGYVMGMYLMRQIGRDGNYKSDLPDFMVFLDWKTLPWHWTFSDSFIATLLLIVLVLPLFIALVCTKRMQRAQMGDVEVFKHLIEIRQNRRSYC
eukprot:gene47100-57684_t